MPTKHQCKVCSRSFVHKESLKEHKLLHGLVIFGANKFSCPLCQSEVTCQFGLHRHGKSKCGKTMQAAEVGQIKEDDHRSYNGTTPGNNINASKNSEGEGIKLRSKSKNSKCKETAETDVANASGSVSCKICSRVFVYQKCLQKHASLVHGLPSEDKPKVETNPDGSGAECVSSHSTKGHVNHQSSLITENYDSVSDSQLATKNISGDSEDSEPDNTNDCASEISPQMIPDEVAKSVELKVDVSDLKCKTCLKQFKHKAMLLRHMHMVHGGTDLDSCTCPLCSKKFSSQWTFSQHFDAEHKPNAAEILASLANGQTPAVASDGTNRSNDISRCEKCSQWFTCWQSFQKHCSLKHRSDWLSLTTHRELHHKSTDSSEPSETFDEDKKPFSNTKPFDSSNSRVDISPSGSSPNKSVQDVSSDSQRSSKYFCSVCNKYFVTVNFLERHMRIKHNSSSVESPNPSGKLEFKKQKQTFVCGYCSEEFNKEDSLSNHVELCHKGLISDSAECTCPVCGCSCPNQTVFSMHYNSEHYMNSALYESASSVLPVCRCKFCELWFTDDEFLCTHLCTKKTTVRQPPKTGRARYRCIQCGEAFEILRRFLHHRKVKHRVVGPDKKDHHVSSVPLTDLPSQTTADAVNGLDGTSAQFTRGRPAKGSDVNMKQDDDDQAQNDTMEQQHTPEGSLSEGPGFSCPECNRLFPTVSLLRRHRKSEHRNRTCQLCGETCKSADMVYYHNLKYHHEQKCEVCGASCCGRLGLIDHFRTQHPTEPPPLINRKTLICEYCPRVFAGCASRLLRDHIESCHLGRVHLCDVCGKRLGSAQTLAVHRRMHDPVARFECRECNRRFPHNTNLMNHIRKHHPERLPAKYIREFRCDVCSMQFGSSSGLSRHRSEKHGSQRFQCDMCLRVFPSVTGLRLHKRRDHQPKEAAAESVPISSSTVAAAEAILTPPSAPQVVAQFNTDPTNAIMAGFMANMIGLPGLGQTFQ